MDRPRPLFFLSEGGQKGYLRLGFVDVGSGVQGSRHPESKRRRRSDLPKGVRSQTLAALLLFPEISEECYDLTNVADCVDGKLNAANENKNGNGHLRLHCGKIR